MNIIQINEENKHVLEVYTMVKERQLLHYCEPHPGVFIAESLRIMERALDAGYEPISMFIEEEQLETPDALSVIARCGDIPIYCTNHEEMIRITRYAVPRGSLCAMRRRRPAPISEVLTADMHRIVVMEDVMNPTNMGAIFRSAAALGMDAILLTPGCADPLYRRSGRVSMGAVFQIPWTYLDKNSMTDGPAQTEPDRLSGSYVQQLKAMGFTTVSMALREDTVSIDDPQLQKKDKIAILLGSENTGLKPSTIAACDYTVRIPMYHGVDSLNVAAASAVAFWELRRRN